MTLLKRLLNFGVTSDLTLAERQRAIILNRMVLLVFSICAVMSIVDLLTGLYWHAGINAFIAGYISQSHFYLVKRHKRALAAFSFISITTILLVVLCILTITQKRLTNVEITMFAIGAAVVFLLRDSQRRIFYVSIMLAYFGLEILKFYVQEWPFDNTFMFVIINSTAVFICIYFFSDLFGREFIRGINRVEKFNEQISAQKEELLQTKLVLTTMIDNLPLILSMVDRNGKYILVNESYVQALAKPKNDILGKHYTEVLPENILRSHGPMIKDSIEGGRAIDFQEETILPEGKKIYAYGTYFPIMDQNGQVYAMTSFVVDISDLKQKEKELERLVATKNKLFSVLAHELKSPVALLQGSLELKSEDLLTQDDWENLFTNVSSKLKILTLSLENMMTWAKSQFDGFRMNRTSVNVRDVVERVMIRLGAILDEKKIKVSLSSDQIVYAYIDPYHLELLIVNLLNNAIKFTPFVGKITVGISALDDAVRLEITDSGVGMSKEQVANILDGNLAESTLGTNQEKGTGIGLVICRDILYYNKGKMELESEQGMGSKFIIILPKS